MIDCCGRIIDYVRISITDRCDLRCVYCMPEGGIQSFEQTEILTFEEILRLVRILTRLGIRHVRVTGGEPMARRNCLDFVSRLRDIPGIEDIAMTTNAMQLAGRLEEARRAGLDALNISLDTLNPEHYRMMTRGGDVEKAKSVIFDALDQGMKVKVNAVPVLGMNDGDLTELAELARTHPVQVRFIELMPIGCGRHVKPIASDDVLAGMEAAFGKLEADPVRHGFGPAKYVKPEGFVGSIGIISPVSHEFCGQCNRIRLTADGYLKLCLNHTVGCDLRALMRGEADDEALYAALRSAIERKPKRHGFLENVDDCERRRMNEIGG